LKDASLVRELVVVPKKTITYLNPCNLGGNFKKQSNASNMWRCVQNFDTTTGHLKSKKTSS